MSKTIQEAIVKEAEAWLGTPWGHQGNIKGVRVDCANLIAACVIAAINAGAELDAIQKFDIPNNYRRQENGELLKFLLDKYLDYVKTEDREAGDIIALCDQNIQDLDIPRHLIIIQSVTVTTFVIDPMLDGVRRHRLNGTWWRRVHSIWRVRDRSNSADNAENQATLLLSPKPETVLNGAETPAKEVVIGN